VPAGEHHLKGKKRNDHADHHGQARYRAQRRQDDEKAQNGEDRTKGPVLKQFEQVP